MPNLAEAQQQREDSLLFAELDRRLDVALSEADTVGPDARHKLRALLRFYAKKPHPFTACVRDNMKRFGPGRTEAVCATLKDIIRGTTHWRGKGNPRDHGSPGLATALSQDDADVIGDALEVLEQLPSSARERVADLVEES